MTMPEDVKPNGKQDARQAGSLDPVRVTLDEEFDPEHHDESDLDENANPIPLPSGDYAALGSIGEPVKVEERRDDDKADR